MNQDKERILNLLKEKKISLKEFKLLDTVIDNKNNFFITIYHFILTPFPKISGMPALILAFLLLISLSFLAWYGQFHFQGLLDHSEIPKGKYMGLLTIFLELFISWLLVSIIFLVSALILQVKSYQIIDFFAYSGLAKFPYFNLAIILIIMKYFDYNLFMTSGQKAGLHSPIGYLWMVIFYILYFWQLRLFFCAYKEATGLSNTKLWLGYIISIALCEAVTLEFVSTFFSGYIRVHL